MQIRSNAEVVFLGVKENIGKEDKKFYEISLEQLDSVCTLPTSVDVFNFVNAPENKNIKYKPVLATFVFDTRFNNFRVVQISNK